MNNLKELRTLHGSTQDELAKAIGTTQGLVANWELGKATPSNENKDRLASFFDVSSIYLFAAPLTEEIREKLSKVHQDKKEKQNNKPRVSQARKATEKKTTKAKLIMDDGDLESYKESFLNHRQKFMFISDSVDLEDLEDLLKICKGTVSRLEAIYNIRKNEEEN